MQHKRLCPLVPGAGITSRAQMGPRNPSLQCSRQPLPRKQNPFMRWDQPVIPQIPWLCHTFLPSKSSCVQWAGPLLCTLDRRRCYERVGAGPRQGPVESRAGVMVPFGPPLHRHPVPSFPRGSLANQAPGPVPGRCLCPQSSPL